MLGVTFITFFLSLQMGDPLAAYVTERTTDEQYDMLAEKHGVNDSELRHQIYMLGLYNYRQFQRFDPFQTESFCMP